MADLDSHEDLSALGQTIPPLNAHAISVSLPTWDDNIGYGEGYPHILTKIRSGYPRFVIHHLVVEVSYP